MELITGKEYKRSQLHNFYGGQDRGGISTPADHDYILSFLIRVGKTMDIKTVGMKQTNFIFIQERGRLEIWNLKVIKLLEITKR